MDKANGEEKRKSFNTTFNEATLDDYKQRCKMMGLPYNMVLEMFMEQFARGEFNVKFGLEKKN